MAHAWAWSSLRSKAHSIRTFSPIRQFVTSPTCRSAFTNSKSYQFASFFLKNDRWPGNAASSGSAASLTSDAPLVARLPQSTRALEVKPVKELTVKNLLKVYSELSKGSLTILNVLTAMSGVALSPIPTTVPVLLATAVGTALCSASANTLNQIQEVPLDAQMPRTRNRPLCRHAISGLHAAGFAITTGIVGPALLWTCVNPTTALLGAGNIALYAGLYTYLKRRHPVNTWVGSVVGAVPPLMGWTACGGQLLPSTAHPIHLYLPSFLSSTDAIPLSLDIAANPLAPLALFALLFSWQFPHFNSLSHWTRSSYAQAGYHMLSVLNPRLNALVALRHAVLLFPICSILIPISGLTTWSFALTSLIPNSICARYAWSFWRQGGDAEARRVFWASLWYVPVMMALMMLHKSGLEWTSWLPVWNNGVEKDAKAAKN